MASAHDPAVAHVALDAHESGDPAPYLYRTDDGGATWVRLAEPGPRDGVRGWIHVVHEDPVDPRLLFVGTEHGLWLSIDRGATWQPFRVGLPRTVAVRDLAYQPRESALVIATHGRGLYVVDHLRPLRDLVRRGSSESRFLGEITPAVRHTRTRPPGPRFPGDGEYEGRNPPYGASLYLWQRTDAESPPRLVIRSLADERVVRTLDAPAAAGLHRVVWDLLPDGGPSLPGGPPLSAFEVVPGHYRVTAQWGDARDNAEHDAILEVLPDPRLGELSKTDREARRDAVERAHALLAEVLEAIGRLHPAARHARRRGWRRGRPPPRARRTPRRPVHSPDASPRQERTPSRPRLRRGRQGSLGARAVGARSDPDAMALPRPRRGHRSTFSRGSATLRERDRPAHTTEPARPGARNPMTETTRSSTWTAALLWILAVVLMFSAAIYQRRTGPTYPLRDEITVGGESTSYRFVRSEETIRDARVVLPAPSTAVEGRVVYKRYKTGDAFTTLPMVLGPAQDGDRTDGQVLVAALPAQPAAGKLEYFVEVDTPDGTVRIPEAGGPTDDADNIIIRFKDPVPTPLLVAHVTFMFFSVLIGMRTGLAALFAPDRVWPWPWVTFAGMTIGGMILGPFVQKYAFGEYWTDSVGLRPDRQQDVDHVGRLARRLHHARHGAPPDHAGRPRHRLGRGPGDDRRVPDPTQYAWLGAGLLEGRPRRARVRGDRHRRLRAPEARANMSAVHLHLLIVHLPVVACPLALVLLAVGHARDRPSLARAGHVTIMIAAAAGIVAYYSGPSAYEQLADRLVADKAWVEQHAVIARLAFVGLVVLGVVTIQVLLQEAQGDTPSPWMRRGLVVGTAILCWVLAWTAHLGGQIRHVEIRTPEWAIFPHVGIEADDLPPAEGPAHPDG